LGLSSWLRSLAEKVSWREVCGLASAGLLGKVLWDHYGILRHSRLPPSNLGPPIIGHTLSIFQNSLDVWGDAALKGKDVLLANYLFGTAALVKYHVYQEHIQRAELDGKLRPEWPAGFKGLLGPNSIIVLPGGKGHQHHKHLRGKILHSLAPKPVLAILPRILEETRRTLDGLVADTAKQGFASLEGPAASMASKLSTLQITAGLEPKLQERMSSLLDDIILGMFSLPLNLGRLTAFGRATQARREVSKIIEGVMSNPNLDHVNIVFDLMHSSESGEAFSRDEIVDTVITLLLAGKLTTADALPALFVRLSENPDWAARIAQEPLEFAGIEQDSATLRFVRESLRVQPPVGAYRRTCIDPSEATDLGEHGRIPPACPFAVVLRSALQGMGQDFNPDRWTSEASRSDGGTVFGGLQPHSCVGKNLALLELQTFARVLCREYDFKALDTTLVVKPSKVMTLSYKDGLRVAVHRKAGA